MVCYRRGWINMVWNRSSRIFMIIAIPKGSNNLVLFARGCGKQLRQNHFHFLLVFARSLFFSKIISDLFSIQVA
ncbi:hypothetical protein CRP01_25715 [Flavilitoribacter nigricans DSM 23189 = NBRC 102662]|uniref:Uncharacterized protein n=1 Tax=Flavilitoribacter nigricans (strain ATCC 23147 / DSM 23189 / NBRC 102662 / NCIMB 1420 / SS-2) TaxID=1122177 RepID=A0A2D0N561_FLAN2|nr:hypothetical protein CRP01_25715 [Flavilitoribacter nigricans DSM 23189 = NBRC 102662]